MLFARIAGVALGLVGIAASARTQILPPTQTTGGFTQSQLADRRWQTFLPIAPATNPITDTTGGDAVAGHLGSIYMPAGSLVDPVTRNVTIPANRTLFFPIKNVIGWDQITGYGPTLAGLQRDPRETLGINASGFAPDATLYSTPMGPRCRWRAVRQACRTTGSSLPRCSITTCRSRMSST